MWVGSALTYGLRRLIGPLGLRFGWAARATRQELTRKDVDSLGNAGFSAQQTVTAFSNGPTAALSYPIVLSPRWYLSTELVGNGWIRQEGTEQFLRPEGSLQVGLGADL